MNANLSDVIVNNLSLNINSDPLVDFKDNITLAQINDVATTIFPHIRGLNRWLAFHILEKAYQSVIAQ